MEVLKRCTVCKLPRPVGDGGAFNKDRSKHDGFSDTCRSCKAGIQAKYLESAKGRKAVQEAVKRYQGTEGGKKAFNKATAKYCASEHGKQKRSEYYNLPEVKDMRRDRGNDYYKKLKKEHPEKCHAYQVVANAIRAGKLIKPDKCEDCPASENIQAHHEDYSKPYEVNWLCPKCHRKRDRERRIREKKGLAASPSARASHPGQGHPQGTPSQTLPSDSVIPS